MDHTRKLPRFAPPREGGTLAGHFGKYWIVGEAHFCAIRANSLGSSVMASLSIIEANLRQIDAGLLFV